MGSFIIIAERVYLRNNSVGVGKNEKGNEIKDFTRSVAYAEGVPPPSCPCQIGIKYRGEEI